MLAHWPWFFPEGMNDSVAFIRLLRIVSCMAGLVMLSLHAAQIPSVTDVQCLRRSDVVHGDLDLSWEEECEHD